MLPGSILQGCGTGFIVGFPIEGLPDREFRYVVTCAHNLERSGGTIRVLLNGEKNGVYFDTLLRDWFVCEEEDVAVLRIKGPYDSRSDVSISYLNLLGQENIDSWEIRPGDEVFMIGRYGPLKRELNEVIPVLKHGHISLMARTDIKFDYKTPEYGKREQVGHLVDMGTISGLSGSPVFVYGTFDRILKYSEHGAIPTGRMFIYLLGMCVAGIDESSIESKGEYIGDESSLDNLEPYALSDSGESRRFISNMSIVLPSTSIYKLLYRDDVLSERNAQCAIELLQDKT